MVMPSKLWRFEWSESGTIVVKNYIFSQIFIVKMNGMVTIYKPKKLILLNLRSETKASQNLAVEFT